MQSFRCSAKYRLLSLMAVLVLLLLVCEYAPPVLAQGSGSTPPHSSARGRVKKHTRTLRRQPTPPPGSGGPP